MNNLLAPTTKNLPYNKFLFERIISRMKPEQVSTVSIEIWAVEGPRCIELLRSGMSAEEFDIWASKATRMIFKGPAQDIFNLVGA